MTPDPSTSCAACGAPVEPSAVCLACAFEGALSSRPGNEVGWDAASAGGFADFAGRADGDFGKYRIKRELGCGGMGVVWEAEDTSLRRTVAIKMIRGFAFSSTGERQRFRREATAVAQLDHPHIVPVYEIGELEGQTYFAMKRLSGGTLSTRLAQGGMGQREAAAIMAKLASALSHAHGCGILHRDLKPDNVLFDQFGEPFLIDFGLAKMLDEVDGLTLTTAHVGTPYYMSPEQARGRPKDITAASDVWGAGALFFHMLMGQPPFTGKSSGEILQKVAHDRPGAMDRAQPAIDKDLQTLCLRCLERDPGLRLPSAAVLEADLSRWLAGHSIQTKPTPFAAKARNRIRKRPMIAAALAIGLLVIAVAVVDFWQGRHGAASPDTSQPSGQERVFRYGDTISLRNRASGEYLDTCGWVYDSELATVLPTQNLFVFTSETLNRGSRPTGTWLIESATGVGIDAPLSFGDRIHLQSKYPSGGWLDNCGYLKDLHFYGESAAGQQNAVSTSLNHRETDGSDVWIVRSPKGKTGHVEAGDAIVLETAFAGGGHLNASGQASRIAAFEGGGFEEVSGIAFVSDRDAVIGESGQWSIKPAD